MSIQQTRTSGRGLLKLANTLWWLMLPMPLYNSAPPHELHENMTSASSGNCAGCVPEHNITIKFNPAIKNCYKATISSLKLLKIQSHLCSAWHSDRALMKTKAPQQSGAKCVWRILTCLYCSEIHPTSIPQIWRFNANAMRRLPALQIFAAYCAIGHCMLLGMTTTSAPTIPTAVSTEKKIPDVPS